MIPDTMKFSFYNYDETYTFVKTAIERGKKVILTATKDYNKFTKESNKFTYEIEIIEWVIKKLKGNHDIST